MPSLFHRSARLPCDAVFPGHHLCITYFNKGVELVVLREAAAVKARQATGREVESLDEVCSRLLRHVEGKLEELKGEGIAQPVLRRMGGCRCPLSSAPCREHRRSCCQSPGCLHFVNLEDEIPSCPLGEHPAQNEVVEEVYPLWLKVKLVKSVFFCHILSEKNQISHSSYSPPLLSLPRIEQLNDILFNLIFYVFDMVLISSHCISTLALHGTLAIGLLENIFARRAMRWTNIHPL